MTHAKSLPARIRAMFPDDVRMINASDADIEAAWTCYSVCYPQHMRAHKEAIPHLLQPNIRRALWKYHAEMM